LAVERFKYLTRASLDYAEALPDPPRDNDSLTTFRSRLSLLFTLNSHRIVDYDLARSHPVMPAESGFGYTEIVRHLAGLWLENLPDLPEPFRQRRQFFIMETAWACILAALGIMVKDVGDVSFLPSKSEDRATPGDITSESRSAVNFIRAQSTTYSDPIPVRRRDGSQGSAPVSQSGFGTSQESTSSRGEKNRSAIQEPRTNYQAIKRLSLLASSIMSGEPIDKARQHSILSKWPEERGVSTEGYVSTVLDNQHKKFEAVRRMKEDREARRSRRAEKYRSLRSMTQEAEPGSNEGQSEGISSQGETLAGLSLSRHSTVLGQSTQGRSSSFPQPPWIEMSRSQERLGSTIGASQSASQGRGPFVFGSQSSQKARKKSSQKRKSGFR
jgi:RNA polymerase I-specific transcription-initiation factor